MNHNILKKIKYGKSFKHNDIFLDFERAKYDDMDKRRCPWLFLF